MSGKGRKRVEMEGDRKAEKSRKGKSEHGGWGDGGFADGAWSVPPSPRLPPSLGATADRSVRQGSVGRRAGSFDWGRVKTESWPDEIIKRGREGCEVHVVRLGSAWPSVLGVVADFPFPLPAGPIGWERGNGRRAWNRGAGRDRGQVAVWGRARGL